MLRGFATTLALVSAVMMGAWAYAEQYRVASATTIPAITPNAVSMTTSSNIAAKGDRLDLQFSGATSIDHDGSLQRIIGAHARAMAENDHNRSMTVALRSAPNETTLMRVNIAR